MIPADRPLPTLRTARLVLRPFTAADAPVVAHFAGDRRIADTTLTIPHPYAPALAEQWIATHGDGWVRGEKLVLAITRATDGLVGAIGLEIARAHRRAELGYWVGVPFWNQGIATEAARAIVAYGFSALGLNKILARHLVRNPASGRVLAHVGMRVDGLQRQHVVKWGVPEDLVELSMLASERDQDSRPDPKLYSTLADWWPVLSAPADYAEEAAFYAERLVETASRPIATILELGSGGGNNASHLKRRFTMTLVDRSPGMLAVSRALNPECEHAEGDMRTVRLDRQFDAVFIHDAVCYLTERDDVRRAMETAYVHCRPGGAVLVAPDHTRESFRTSTSHGGEDLAGRALRYLAWTWDPDLDDTTYTVDLAYLLRDRDGSMRVEWDRHVEGLFGRDEWLGWLREAGFEARAVPFSHSELGPDPVEVFVGRRLE